MRETECKMNRFLAGKGPRRVGIFRIFSGGWFGMKRGRLGGHRPDLPEKGALSATPAGAGGGKGGKNKAVTC
ncbi:MAG: hypothetical protein AVDCRST_MAG56-1043 [uncultured Cytophagales bacterium]|uniref:Uncharacterized protein n=1 Tax=uncultured Cytophagales bacterium TaxID=158755 RepID=A0A6J4HTQ9_9SPHI|nr:MAG: hypothetical protein AVDCRST_MAG56-1043 [uncultured Cytophagales bacterium]